MSNDDVISMEEYNASDPGPIDTLKETNRVTRQRKRAKKAGLPATLTLAQWKKTLIYYNQRCAYCKKNRFRVLDHFIPLAYGDEGTTATNCVPACDTCNDLKLDIHPSMITEISSLFLAMREVQQYLKQCSAEAEL